MYHSNIEFGSIVAAERFRSLREEHLRSRSMARTASPHLQALARRSGRMLLGISIRLLRYSRQPANLSHASTQA